jgi:hypothetical protein
MGPIRRSAKRQSSAFGLNLVADCGGIVVLKWCSPYYQLALRLSRLQFDGRNFSRCSVVFERSDRLSRRVENTIRRDLVICTLCMKLYIVTKQVAHDSHPLRMRYVQKSPTSCSARKNTALRIQMI